LRNRHKGASPGAVQGAEPVVHLNT